jgi:hypothetical protein
MTMKNHEAFATTDRPLVTIRLKGDLRLQTQDVPEVTVESDYPFTLTGGGEVATINGERDLDVKVPVDSQIHLSACAGDARISGVRGPIQIKAVGGDLVLRKVGSIEAGTVGGDVNARGLDGSFEVVAGGDIVFTAQLSSDHDYWLNAGGDIIWRTPPGASATLEVAAGGEVITRVPGVKHAPGGVIIGDGAALGHFQAGGDIVINAETDADPIGQAATEIEARVRSITENAMDKVARKLEDAQRKLERSGRRGRWGVGYVVPDVPRPLERPVPPAPPSEPVSNEERLAILRLVENGKITAGEAARLLAALDGR